MTNRVALNARLRNQKAKAFAGTFVQALKFQQIGRLPDAQALCNDILSRFPHHFDALHLLGVTHYQLGNCQDAEHLLRRAIAADPYSAEAHCNLSAVLLAFKRYEEAVACCDQALFIRPDYPEALSNRGGALTELGRFEEAIDDYDKALEIKPDFAATLGNRGAALSELRRYEEAVASCAAATEVDPRHAPSFSNLGNALLGLNRSNEALESFDKAIEINPDLPAAWLGRGNACFNLKRLEEARAAFRQAIAIKPDYVKAFGQLALCDEREGNIEAAIAGYDRALAIAPDYLEGVSQKIFCLDFVADATFLEHQEARRHWWQHIGAKIAARCQFPRVNNLDPDRPLVLGYISSDFRRHSAALVFRPVLRSHDRSRFRVICYSCSIVQDEGTEEFRKIADLWRDASRSSDDRLAQKVHTDNVDILIDLSGHTAGHRLGVFARKPAPIQVTAWGNATGSGLPTIDYLFSDPVSVPPSVRHLFAEKIWDLPCCITVDQKPGELSPTDPPVLVNGYVTFGMFNRTSKISEASAAVWAEILHRQPQSRLLIKHFEVEDEAVRTRLSDMFRKHGVADRLDFLGSSQRHEHLAAYAKVDICLDPFPQNGGISTWEALQMGVPVVAKLGNSVPSRVAGAILTAVGLDEWVADTPERYVEIAFKHASDRERLKTLRHELPGRILASSAGNAEKYTRAVEDAYRSMWADYCRRSS